MVVGSESLVAVVVAGGVGAGVVVATVVGSGSGVGVVEPFSDGGWEPGGVWEGVEPVTGVLVVEGIGGVGLAGVGLTGVDVDCVEGVATGVDCFEGVCVFSEVVTVGGIVLSMGEGVEVGGLSKPAVQAVKRIGISRNPKAIADRPI